MPVSRQDVIQAFHLILDREPGSEEGITAHMQLQDLTELGNVLLASAEFRASPRFEQILSARVDASSSAAVVQAAHDVRDSQRVLLLGNCQAATVGRLMQAMSGDMVANAVETTPATLRKLDEGTLDLAPMLAQSELVFVQLLGDVSRLIQDRYPAHAHKVRMFPPLNFPAFHPDCVYVKDGEGRHFQGPMGDYHSSLVFWAWSQGWKPLEAITLFRDEVYSVLGFHQYDETARKVLLDFGQLAGIRLDDLVDRWMRGGHWMHTVNHPHVHALADLTAAMLAREGIKPMREMAAFVPDALTRFPVWPVYPPIAARLGGAGSYSFKIDDVYGTSAQPLLALSLEQLVNASYACYDAAGPDRLSCERLQDERYAALSSFHPSSTAGRTASSAAASSSTRTLARSGPYVGLPDHQFWRRAIELTPAAEVDPVIRVGRPIGPQDKVATAGSCFAQHIARTLASNGFRYFVTEAGDELRTKDRLQRQFGVFSARYGNIYTARQLLQLVDRAYGRFQPADEAWLRPDGRYVDPFRPQVEPDGFAGSEEVAAARDIHLSAVRRMVEEMDVFVFTLGLTEAWRRRCDGAVFPLAPGVVAGSWDPALYEFINLDVATVVRDIRAAVSAVRERNPRARFIFSVSPVPLIATYENRHVLVSTIESKAVLRAAIGQVVAQDPGIDYFPSYEIITGPQAQGRYFAADLRSVTDAGVAHVMKVFLRHYGQLGAPEPTGASSGSAAGQRRQEAEQRNLNEVVCDEEAIERHRQ
jgi:hypothetical protein